MKVLFVDSWVGTYVGEGDYEGGTCPDILITNVPDDINTDHLFDMYLDVLCDGFHDYDEKDYEPEITDKDYPETVVITSKDELVDCEEEFIQVDYNDLLKWSPFVN